MHQGNFTVHCAFGILTLSSNCSKSGAQNQSFLVLSDGGHLAEALTAFYLKIIGKSRYANFDHFSCVKCKFYELMLVVDTYFI